MNIQYIVVKKEFNVVVKIEGEYSIRLYWNPHLADWSRQYV